MSTVVQSPFCVFCGDKVATDPTYLQCPACGALICASCRQKEGAVCPDCKIEFKAVAHDSPGFAANPAPSPAPPPESSPDNGHQDSSPEPVRSGIPGGGTNAARDTMDTSSPASGPKQPQGSTVDPQNAKPKFGDIDVYDTSSSKWRHKSFLTNRRFGPRIVALSLLILIAAAIAAGFQFHNGWRPFDRSGQSPSSSSYYSYPRSARPASTTVQAGDLLHSSGTTAFGTNAHPVESLERNIKYGSMNRETWIGILSGKSARLEIGYETAGRFSGALKSDNDIIQVEGSINRQNHEVEFKETLIIVGPNWSLGADKGTLNNDGTVISGTGRDIRGTSYTWRFNLVGHGVGVGRPVSRTVGALVKRAYAAVPVTVQLRANEEWRSTHIVVKKGDRLSITASGTWTHGTEGLSEPFYGPDGYSKKIVSWSGFPVYGTRIGALAGRLGNGRAFLIGSSRKLIAEDTGELMLTMNNSTGNYGNNKGSMRIVVHISRQG